MDIEKRIASSAHFIELSGAAVLLSGALLAGGIFTRRLLDKGIFHDACDAFAGLGIAAPRPGNVRAARNEAQCLRVPAKRGPAINHLPDQRRTHFTPMA